MFTDYIDSNAMDDAAPAWKHPIHSCQELIDCIQQVGFLPLLESGIPGFAAECLMAEECRYTQFEDGSWEWPLWRWKGQVVRESDCVYGKFFDGKAGFVSLEWWPYLCHWRRSISPIPADDSVEALILAALRDNGSMVARELRAACGLTAKGMRSRFDAYVTRLQKSCHIVTEDFVYPVDKHGREYGFGWSLLTTPEHLLGREACQCDLEPLDTYTRMWEWLSQQLPQATPHQILRLLGFKETDRL